MIKSLFKEINCWDDFVNKQTSLNNTDKGAFFELLTKLYFKTNPLYHDYDDVWLLKEVPQKELDNLKISRQDLGIDLIAKKGKEYHAIQCKYHGDKNKNVTFKEVATFLQMVESNKKIEMGYICSSANGTSRNYQKIQKKNIQEILSDSWQLLNKENFNNFRKVLNKKAVTYKPFKPRKHQKKAIKQAKNHFIKENNSRGKLIFPCGAGKSLTGFWLAEALESKATLIAVPSLSLVKQTLEVYLREIVANKIKVEWLCICSDEGIGTSDDVAVMTNNIGVACKTDPKYIKDWLKENKNVHKIIFTTYQSGHLIADISKKLKMSFDVGIFDEAHKTVGSSLKQFSYLLFEKNIKIDKRIFMTATERFYSGSKEDIISMDDEGVYGAIFTQMSFKEAIDLNLLTDYKVITIEIKKSEIAEFIKDNNLVQLNDKWKKETEARSLASMLAMRKAMKKFKIKNVVSFHSSIEKAKRNKELQEYITNTYNYKPIDTFTVSGKIPTSKRNDIVQEFAKSNRALITNARCLTEGIDVPNIDCIVFADPRKSRVDIVQALGRALRKKEGKEWGYVILPVVYDGKTNEIDNDNFNEIINIVRGLAANDERIVEYFKDKSKNGNSKREMVGGSEVFSFDSSMLSEKDLAGQLQIKIWEKLSRFNWMPFEEAREFVRKLNIKGYKEWKVAYKDGIIPKNIPIFPDSHVYIDKWISWYDWLGNENRSPKNVFDKGYEEIKKYIANYGNSYVKEKHKTHDSFKLGQFCKMIRNHNAFEEQRHKLSQLSGWVWEVGEDKFQKTFKELKKIEVIDGKLVVPKSIRLEIGDFSVNLYGWTMSVRKRYGEVNAKDFKASKFKNAIFENKFDPRIKMFDKLKGWAWSNKKQFPSFEDAKKIVFQMKISNYKAYLDKLRQKNIHNLPFKPFNTYKKDWIDMHDFFGKEGVSNFQKAKNKFSYNEAKNFITKNCKGLVTSMGSFNKWKKEQISGLPIFPQRMPQAPWASYKKEWESSYKFFGKEHKKVKKHDYSHYKYEKISYGELKKIVHKHNLNSRSEYKEWLDKNKSIFSKQGLYAPVKAESYKNEFEGWTEFLGK